MFFMQVPNSSIGKWCSHAVDNNEVEDTVVSVRYGGICFKTRPSL